MLHLVVTLASWPVRDAKVSFGEIFKRMQNSFVFMITSKYICKSSLTWIHFSIVNYWWRHHHVIFRCDVFGVKKRKSCQKCRMDACLKQEKSFSWEFNWFVHIIYYMYLYTYIEHSTTLVFGATTYGCCTLSCTNSTTWSSVTLYRSKHIFNRNSSDWNSAGKASHYVGFDCVSFLGRISNGTPWLLMLFTIILAKKQCSIVQDLICTSQ